MERERGLEVAAEKNKRGEREEERNIKLILTGSRQWVTVSAPHTVRNRNRRIRWVTSYTAEG